jgi:hypothetical protein
LGILHFLYFIFSPGSSQGLKEIEDCFQQPDNQEDDCDNQSNMDQRAQTKDEKSQQPQDQENNTNN